MWSTVPQGHITFSQNSQSHYRKHPDIQHYRHGNCTASDRKALQWVIKASETIIGIAITDIKSIGERRGLKRPQRIIKDNADPNHGLSVPPAIWKALQNHSRPANILSNTFTQTVRLLNSSPHKESSNISSYNCY